MITAACCTEGVLVTKLKLVLSLWSSNIKK